MSLKLTTYKNNGITFTEGRGFFSFRYYFNGRDFTCSVKHFHHGWIGTTSPTGTTWPLDVRQEIFATIEEALFFIGYPYDLLPSGIPECLRDLTVNFTTRGTGNIG